MVTETGARRRSAPRRPSGSPAAPGLPRSRLFFADRDPVGLVLAALTLLTWRGRWLLPSLIRALAIPPTYRLGLLGLRLRGWR